MNSKLLIDQIKKEDRPTIAQLKVKAPTNRTELDEYLADSFGIDFVVWDAPDNGLSECLGVLYVPVQEGIAEVPYMRKSLEDGAEDIDWTELVVHASFETIEERTADLQHYYQVLEDHMRAWVIV